MRSSLAPEWFDTRIETMLAQAARDVGGGFNVTEPAPLASAMACDDRDAELRAGGGRGTIAIRLQ